MVLAAVEKKNGTKNTRLISLHDFFQGILQRPLAPPPPKTPENLLMHKKCGTFDLIDWIYFFFFGLL
jgi:hypothetical protein